MRERYSSAESEEETAVIQLPRGQESERQRHRHGEAKVESDRQIGREITCTAWDVHKEADRQRKRERHRHRLT